VSRDSRKPVDHADEPCAIHLDAGGQWHAGKSRPDHPRAQDHRGSNSVSAPNGVDAVPPIVAQMVRVGRADSARVGLAMSKAGIVRWLLSPGRQNVEKAGGLLASMRLCGLDERTQTRQTGRRAAGIHGVTSIATRQGQVIGRLPKPLRGGRADLTRHEWACAPGATSALKARSIGFATPPRGDGAMRWAVTCTDL